MKARAGEFLHTRSPSLHLDAIHIPSRPSCAHRGLLSQYDNMFGQHCLSAHPGTIEVLKELGGDFSKIPIHDLKCAEHLLMKPKQYLELPRVMLDAARLKLGPLRQLKSSSDPGKNFVFEVGKVIRTRQIVRKRKWAHIPSALFAVFDVAFLYVRHIAAPRVHLPRACLPIPMVGWRPALEVDRRYKEHVRCKM